MLGKKENMLNKSELLLVDSHCHLDFDSLADDLPGVVSRARENGVAYMVTICTKISEFDQIHNIATRFENVFCSAGLHPNNVAEDPEYSTDDLLSLARRPKVVGIGETGLDFHYDYTPPRDQEESFRKHLTVARETQLPVIVHSRSAEDETIRILQEEYGAGAFPGVLHCFSSEGYLADAALELGFYVSFAGILTFKNAGDLRATAERVPLERLLVETDAPYLAPVPMRGKTNEPAFVRHTAERLAEIRDLSTEEIFNITTGNFFNLFAKAKPVSKGAE